MPAFKKECRHRPGRSPPYALPIGESAAPTGKNHNNAQIACVSEGMLNGQRQGRDFRARPASSTSRRWRSPCPPPRKREEPTRTHAGGASSLQPRRTTDCRLPPVRPAGVKHQSPVARPPKRLGPKAQPQRVGPRTSVASNGPRLQLAIQHKEQTQATPKHQRLYNICATMRYVDPAPHGRKLDV